MYQYKVVFRNKEDGSYFIPTITAFTKRDLNAQIIHKRPDDYRYIRTITNVPGKLSNLNPMMPDMVLNEGKAKAEA